MVTYSSKKKNSGKGREEMDALADEWNRRHKKSMVGKKMKLADFLRNDIKKQD